MSYQDWTQQQKQALKAWIAEQTTGDTVQLRRAVMDKPVVGHNDWDEEKPRDSFNVKVEKELLQIASAYGITKQDSIVQAIAKITNDKDELIFRMDYLYLRSLDVSGDDNIIVHHHDPIYGQSPAEVMGLGGVDGDDIEVAERDINGVYC